jgi:UDP-2,3-diacylglucosamine pyrophosphatase LpxH
MMPPPRDIKTMWRESAARDSEPDESSPTPQRSFRAIFISDCHLGTPGCQAAALLEFLRVTESDYLYLVGDIIDGWQLRRRWYWHQLHNDVIQKVLRKVRKGTQVVYVPGNHDEAARHYVGVDFGGVAIRHEATHVTHAGLRLLITHGDRFDGVVTCARWLALLGDQLYTLILKLNQHFNAARARMGLPYWSLSQFLKLKVKNAVSFITAFEEALAREARSRDFDGVVCGHIHHAEIRSIDKVLYCNCGDWVESLTALVEAHDGTLSILRWQDMVAATILAPTTATPIGAVATAQREPA